MMGMAFLFFLNGYIQSELKFSGLFTEMLLHILFHNTFIQYSVTSLYQIFLKWNGTSHHGDLIVQFLDPSLIFVFFNILLKLCFVSLDVYPLHE